MGKVKKQKRHLKFSYNKDRKKEWKKSKKMPTIKCQEIKKAWDETRTVSQNLRDMGISADANKTIRIPRSKPMQMGTLDVDMEVDLEKTPIKKFVINDLEKQAQLPGKKKMSMSDEEAGFCVYMMDTYGEDYKAMARDSRNYYQETPKQIKRKINRFKSIPKMYEVYAEAKTDHLSSEETSRLAISPQRCVTRRYEACLRNGHFVSHPASDDSAAVFVPHATVCRVRRKLHFGRKPPKEREIFSEQ